MLGAVQTVSLLPWKIQLFLLLQLLQQELIPFMLLLEDVLDPMPLLLLQLIKPQLLPLQEVIQRCVPEILFH